MTVTALPYCGGCLGCTLGHVCSFWGEAVREDAPTKCHQVPSTYLSQFPPEPQITFFSDARDRHKRALSRAIPLSNMERDISDKAHHSSPRSPQLQVTIKNISSAPLSLVPSRNGTQTFP